MFETLRWHTLERLFRFRRLQGWSVCLFCLTSAGLERMKHVLEGRLKRSSPCRIRSTPGRDRARGLSETSEKRVNFCILSSIRPSCSWILAYKQSLNENNIRENIISKLTSFPNWLLISSPRHFFHGHTSKRLAYCRTTAMSLLFDIIFHG